MRQHMLNGWLVAAIIALVCLLGITAYMEVSNDLPTRRLHAGPEGDRQEGRAGGELLDGVLRQHHPERLIAGRLKTAILVEAVARRGRRGSLRGRSGSDQSRRKERPGAEPRGSFNGSEILELQGFQACWPSNLARASRTRLVFLRAHSPSAPTGTSSSWPSSVSS